MRSKRKSLVTAGVAIGLAGGILAFATTADAAANLTVSLTASGTGSSAVWNSAGNPVLTVGSSAGSYAEIQIDNAGTVAPTTAPTFTTSYYDNGSPHWLISFAGGDALEGYPAQGGSIWQIVAGGGACASTGARDLTYVNALAAINTAGCGGNVTSAYIVADTLQPAGTSDTITGIDYNGMTLAIGADVVTVTSPGTQTSTVGTTISTLQIAASSNKGDSITSYAATNLPPGLSLNTSTGAITGTPTTAGSYQVTITVTDSGGTQGSVTFTWVVNAASGTGTGTGTTKYSGAIHLTKMGLCLDDRNNSSSPGAIVQVWGCNGLSNQVWQVMSNGTIEHNGLCLDARNSGVTNGTRVQLWTCTGKANQQWNTSGWRVHYTNPSASGMVLDDTGFGHAGTQQEIWTNNGGRNQVWSTT